MKGTVGVLLAVVVNMQQLRTARNQRVSVQIPDQPGGLI